MSDIKNVIVVGASGNLGPGILQALILSQKFTVSVLTRTTTTSSSAFPSTVTVHKTDYSPASLESAFKGQDAIVSVIAGAGLGEQKKIVDAAIKAGVKRFIPSEFGSNTDSKEAQALVPVFSRKIEIREYLDSKSSDGLTWTGIVTGPIFDRSLKLGFLGFDIASKRATIYDAGDRPFTTTTSTQLGSAVVGVLTKPEAGKNKYVYVGSFTTTQNEVLSALESATGSKWTVEKTSSAEKVNLGKDRVVGRRDSSAIRPLVTAAMYHEKGGSDFESEVGLSNDSLGLKKESLEQVVKSVVQSLGI